MLKNECNGLYERAGYALGAREKKLDFNAGRAAGGEVAPLIFWIETRKTSRSRDPSAQHPSDTIRTDQYASSDEPAIITVLRSAPAGIVGGIN